MKKLLLFGSNSIHTYNYFQIIKDFFDDILLITDKPAGICESIPKLIVNYSFKHPLNILKAISTTRKIIDDYQPNVIHLQQIDTRAFCALKALRKKNIPVVVTAWGSDVLINPKKNRVLKKMVRFILENGTCFTADSRCVASEMRKLTKKNLNITIANFGVDIETTVCEKENIIFSNRLHQPLYRIDTIVYAFKRFVENHPDWKLVIAAEGSETAKLKELVQSLNLNECVSFVGWLNKSQNAHYYSISKYWVSIPESDGVSISLLEAMSMNCIPIVSALPAKYEWILHNVNGFLVDDIDSDFISEAMNVPQDIAQVVNKRLIAEKAIKSINKEKFVSIYQKMLMN
jgi:L-malate glycosyltransferase